MTKLIVLNEWASQYMAADQDLTLTTRQRERIRSQVIGKIVAMLQGTARKVISRKNISHDNDDAHQHIMIAVMKALGSWDPEVASFSTHVYYHMQWELGNYQHYAHPERRRIRTQHPVRFIELDRRIKSDNGEELDCLVNFFPDEKAQEAIEENLQRSQAYDYIDSVISFYMQRKIVHMKKLENGRLISEKETYSLCRDIDIFLSIKIQGESHGDMAEVCGITRERVRQIVATIDRKIARYMPQINGNDYQEAEERYRGETHHLWQSLVSWYYMHSKRDLRWNKTFPLMTYEQVLEFLPPITNENTRRPVTVEVIDSNQIDENFHKIMAKEKQQRTEPAEQMLLPLMTATSKPAKQEFAIRA